MTHMLVSSLCIAQLMLAASSGATSAADKSVTTFTQAATQLNLFQVQAGKLAQRKALQAKTRTYAGDAGSAATEAQQDLAEAAKADGVTVPISLDKNRTETLAALEASPPKDFDAAYMSSQMTTSADVDRLYQGFIKDGPAGRVRTYAETNYPQMHVMGVRAGSQASPGTLTDGEE